MMRQALDRDEEEDFSQAPSRHTSREVAPASSEQTFLQDNTTAQQQPTYPMMQQAPSNQDTNFSEYRSPLRSMSGELESISSSQSTDFIPYPYVNITTGVASPSHLQQPRMAGDTGMYYQLNQSGGPSSQQMYYPASDLPSSPQSAYPNVMASAPVFSTQQYQQYEAPSFAPQQTYHYHPSSYMANAQHASNSQPYYLSQQPMWPQPTHSSRQQQQIYQQQPQQQQQYTYAQPYQQQYPQQSDHNTSQFSRPNYYPYQSNDQAFTKNIQISNYGNVRPKTGVASGLPNRPGMAAASSFATTRSGSGATLEAADRRIDSSGSLPPGTEVIYTNLDARVPGKGLRQHYHPQQGPRSEHVLWCGNVPSDASVEELWNFFSTLPPDSVDATDDPGDQLRKELLSEGESAEVANQALASSDPALSPTSGHGVLSVFIIARSNCAFVNYASHRHLQRAVLHFHGQSLRPIDPRCPRLVCRVRKKDDEAQAGVAGQRGRGIHVAWVKEQDRKMKQDAQLKEDLHRSTPVPTSTNVKVDEPVKAARSDLEEESSIARADSSLASLIQAAKIVPVEEKRQSISTGEGSSGSVSFTSTNSSLFRHPAFHERFFILKSLGTDDLDRSIQTGLWATQPHNEQVLDQAFRNSQSVYLIFSANQSGGFYGYARMTGAILSSREVQQQRQTESGTILPPLTSQASRRASTIRPEAIPETEESLQRDTSDDPSNTAAKALPTDGSSSLAPMTSPLPLTPAGEIESPMAKFTPVDSQSWPPQKQKVQIEEHRNQSYTNPSSSSSEIQPSVLDQYTGEEATGDTVGNNKRRDFIQLAKSTAGASSSSLPARTPLSESGSIGPSDSASLDSKSQQQLAIRAMIHNLRLEEKESQIKADGLERIMIEQTVLDPSQKSAPSSGEISVQSDTPRAGSSDSWGKPFKVEWIKTHSVSFNQVKKLRNPWRDNRQIKVSRDGTELEPNIGRILLKEWDRTNVEDSKTQASGSATTQMTAGDGDEDEV